jgi:hypothetical protein
METLNAVAAAAGFAMVSPDEEDEAITIRKRARDTELQDSAVGRQIETTTSQRLSDKVSGFLDSWMPKMPA